MDTLEENLRSYQEELHDTNMYVASLEDYLQEGKEEHANIDMDKEPDAGPLPSVSPAQMENAETTAEKNITDFVEIRDITFKKINGDLVLNFSLANSGSEENAAEGYIHISAMDINKECPGTWNNSDRLKGCTPVNYWYGQQFLIQRFRPYHKSFKLSSESELPSYIKIFIYDRSGHIILEKELPVINVSAAENT